MVMLWPFFTNLFKINTLNPNNKSIVNGIHADLSFWSKYIDAFIYNNPCINLYLAHHVTPPPSGASILPLEKYKYKNDIPIIIVIIPNIWNHSVDKYNGNIAKMLLIPIQPIKNIIILYFSFNIIY